MIWPRIFLYGWLAFLAGVGVASFVGITSFLFWLVAASAVFLLLAGLASRKHKIAVSGILLAAFILGFWRFEVVWQYSQDNALTRLNGKTAQISGIIVNDPVFKPESQQTIVAPDGIDGKILVLARRYPEYRYGDRVEFGGQLETPQNFDSFDYKNYLAKDGIYSMARFPEVHLISKGDGDIAYAGLFWIKHKLEQGVNQSLPAPQNALLAAILFGDQAGLSGCSAQEIEADPDCAKLKEQLNISGLRHLSAVSGTHITIMAGIIAPFLVWLGFWRRKALWATIVFIWSFILMIGLPASAVRAGVMGSLMIIAGIIGRPADILRLVALAAAFMVLQNPLALRFDVGFQLSFFAILGMVFFARPIEAKLKFIPAKPEFLRQAPAVALSAQIFTLPILIYNFGYVSAYSLFANVLVEPVVPFITIYGFILAIAAAINSVLGWLLFFPMWLALSYLLAAAEFFAKLPAAAMNFEMDFLWLAASYVFLAVIAWRVREREKYRFLGSR